MVPRLGNNGLEGRELFVGHGEGAEEVLLEEGGAGEGEEEGAREGLAAEGLAQYCRDGKFSRMQSRYSRRTGLTVAMSTRESRMH